MFLNNVIICWNTTSSHDFEWVFPISFTSINYIVGPISLWIDGVGSVQCTKTVSSVTFQCQARHSASFGGYYAIGY